MAASSTGIKALLTGSDPVADKLLSHVSHFVIGPVRKQFATGPLGLRDEQYDNIEEENSKAQRRNYEVLRMWRNRSYGETVKTFVDKLVLWQVAGYVAGQVWEKIRTIVEPSLLPAELPSPTATNRWDDNYGNSVPIIPFAAPSIPSSTAAKRSYDDDTAAAHRVAPCVLEEEWMRDIQTYTRESLRRRLRNYLSNDWLPVNKAKSFPLKQFYVELDWTKTIKGLRDRQEPLNRIHDIFTLNIGSSAVTVLVRGEPGVGKSCSMAMLAMDWAEDDTAAEPSPKRTRLDSDSKASLRNFDFVFLIQLSKVDSNIPLEEVIIQQHSRLKSKNVPRDQIATVLQRKKVLLLFDGYDEYKKGTNSAIDDAITNSIGNCFVIVTSRPGDYMEQSDVDQLDGEIAITGLSYENIVNCATGYLQSLLALQNDMEAAENGCKNLIEQAMKIGIYELLKIPIILLMVCVLYSSSHTLPDTKTDIVWEIIKMCMDRSTLRVLDKKSSQIENLDEMLFILGELSWLALQRKTKQLLISKADIEKTGFKDILKLGLLHGANPDEATLEEEPEWLTYSHKLFQDFLAGFYSSKKSLKDIKSMFESWDDIDQKFEVFLFMCGIMEDPSPAIDHMCEQYATEISTHPDAYPRPYLLLKITAEIRSKEKFLNPLCNERFYYVWELPLTQQSGFYFFGQNLDWLNIGDNAKTTHKTYIRDPKEIDCHVIIDGTSLPPRDVLHTISTLRQTISYLSIKEPFVVQDEACHCIPDHIFKIDPSATYINIYRDVILPKSISKHLGRQISTCYNLSHLWIPNQLFVAAEIIDFLGTNRNLSMLYIGGCNLPESKMGKLCQQFHYLSNLQQCYLSGNDLGDSVSVLAESIKSWGVNNSLNTLDLQHCNITPGGCARLLEAIKICRNLIKLDLCGNTISGAFDALISKPSFPWLFNLRLADTSLTSEDIQRIGSLIKEHKIPLLCFLDLSYGNLDSLELDTLGTLEALNSIIQKVPDVYFWKGDDLQDLKKIQECITRGISKYKLKNATN